MLEILSAAYGVIGWIGKHADIIGPIASALGVPFLIPRSWTEKFGYYCGRALQKFIFRKSGLDAKSKLWSNIRNTLHDFFKGLSRGLGAKVS